jgi:Dolichyl-phosphate-mannose-protein mannosyltransferase
VKFARSVWIFLAAGIALRCVAINQPLVDAHLLRQCQTAAATKSLIEQSGFHLSSKITWLGDFDGHYLMELPLYNYLVIGVHSLVSNLDLSGKLATIVLWAAGFVCLQFIWRRILDPQQTFWANLLFVIAPLSVFYGQAFMPEMLLQLLAFAFVWQLMRYNETPAISRWILVVALGLTALLVKLPETAHLYLILALLLLGREGWKGLFRPRYLIAGVVTIVAIKGWSRYMDSVNAIYMPKWTSSEALPYVVGRLTDRLHFKPWAMAFLYVAAFIIPGPALVATAYGFLVFLRQRRVSFLSIWLASLAVFYLVWFGTGPTAQSYYNLPSLAPLCALFAIGMREILAMKWIRPWQTVISVFAGVLIVLSASPFWQYLFKQDRQLLAAARWAKENTSPNDIILFRANHRWDITDYPENPVPAYYSERTTFIWSRYMPETIAQPALERARYAVVTVPQSAPANSLAILNRFREVRAPQLESPEWLEQNGFRPVEKHIGFEVFKKN